MTEVVFARRGQSPLTVAMAAGDRLLDVAQAAGMPLEGTCGGDMACATCHVAIDPVDFAKLPPASEEEAGLIDLLGNAVRTSRLACQLYAGPEWGTLRVVIPD